MKIIISRKGFDSGTGGCPSPIFPDGTMHSLPIPGGSRQRYSQIATAHGSMGAIVDDLTRSRMSGHHTAHLDPDLSADSMPRMPGWRPSLGQTGIAQSHLAGQGVGVGDVFLFFGWFRPVEQGKTGWRYVPGSVSQHVLFGHLQVGSIIPLGARPNVEQVLEENPWLKNHPHLCGVRDANNTLYVASDSLVLDGTPTGLPGGGAWTHHRPDRVLSAPEGPKSSWAIPDWLMPRSDRPPLSYHGAPERWTRTPQGEARLATVAKGQEFVWEATDVPDVAAWIRQCATPSPTIRPTIKP